MTRITESLRSVFQTKKKVVVISGAVAAGVLVTLLCIWAVLLVFSDDPTRTAGKRNAGTGQALEGDAGPGQASGIDRSALLVLEPFEKIPLKNSKTMGYLNVDIALELSDSGASDLLNKSINEVRRMIERTAGEMTWFELRSPEGKINLKYRLIEKINSLYTGAVVQNLYFTSFLMQ